MDSEGRFQVAVGAIIEGPDGSILLIHRSQNQVAGDIWEFPMGRLKQFESFEDGIKREVYEETGLEKVEIGPPVSVFSFMRGGDTAEHEVKGMVFSCKASSSAVKLSDEHVAFKWLPLDEAIAFVQHPGIKHDLVNYRNLTRSHT